MRVNTPGQVRSGQVRSESLTCTFRAQVNKGGGSTGGAPALAGTREYEQSDRGWFEVLWNLECPVGLSQRNIRAHFNEGNVAQFGGSAEKLRFVEPRGDF